jgi:isopenicillin-N N-acyltransferase-like protein
MLDVIDLGGSLYGMGFTHGRALAEKIHEFCEIRIELCESEIAEAGLAITRDEILARAGDYVRLQEKLLPRSHEEFTGISDGAGIAVEKLLVGSGYTDFHDYLGTIHVSVHGCTSFLVKPAASKAGCTFVGQSWDMHASAEPYAVVLRRNPESGPKSLVFSTAGCLGLIGLNEHGIAIGINNLASTDSLPGLTFPLLVNEALGKETLEEARDVFTAAKRSAGRNFFMGDAQGKVLDIEATAGRYQIIYPEENTFAHANHFISDEMKPFEANPRIQSSLHRHKRMTALLHEAEGAIDLDVLHRFLSDREGGEELAICRHGEVRSCGAVIMCPEKGAFFAMKGPPDGGDFFRIPFK